MLNRSKITSNIQPISFKILDKEDLPPLNKLVALKDAKSGPI